MLSRHDFPAGFVFGTATIANRIAGDEKRFGLVWLDCTGLQRRPKSSYHARDRARTRNT